jgi:hypothetical protein
MRSTSGTTLRSLRPHRPGQLDEIEGAQLAVTTPFASVLTVTLAEFETSPPRSGAPAPTLPFDARQ